MISLTPKQLELVHAILRKHVPRIRVLAFGSRVTEKVKPHSDLDLALDGDQAFSLSEIGKLREDFSASSLPFRVDVVDLNKIAESFRKMILQKYEVLQEPLKTVTG
jgi:predicted nucleotidyltransferase